MLHEAFVLSHAKEYGRQGLLDGVCVAAVYALTVQWSAAACNVSARASKAGWQVSREPSANTQLTE